MEKLLHILFIIIALLTIFEFYFISGMFTSLIMMISICIIGLINTVYAAIHKQVNETALYIICTISLCIGYLKIML